MNPNGAPILTGAFSSEGFTLIQGNLGGGPSSRIDFFSSTECDPSGYGEGANLIGTVTVEADASGNFSALIPAALAAGAIVTGTKPVSEFSACRTVSDELPQLILDVAPDSGDSGGTPVTITGSGFLPGASVMVGGMPVSNAVVIDPFHITATTPLLPPGALHDVAVASSTPLAARWMADFLDVPEIDIHHASVETVFRRGVAVGCAPGYFCRNSPVRRDQMAVFLQKIKHGPLFVPPACTPPGRFLDVACPGPSRTGSSSSRPRATPPDAAEATTARATRSGATRWPSSCSRCFTGGGSCRAPAPESSATCPVLPSSPTGSRTSHERASRRDAEAATTARAAPARGPRWRHSS